MSRRWKARARQVLALAAVASCAACQSQKVDTASLAEAERIQAYNHALAASTEAINEGDLLAAREHLDEASDLATQERELEKIVTLEQFIVGAEALLIGDAQLASLEWSQINDPALGPEVRDKARLIGMTVPETPAGGDDQ